MPKYSIDDFQSAILGLRNRNGEQQHIADLTADALELSSASGHVSMELALARFREKLTERNLASQLPSETQEEITKALGQALVAVVLAAKALDVDLEYVQIKAINDTIAS